MMQPFGTLSNRQMRRIAFKMGFMDNQPAANIKTVADRDTEFEHAFFERFHSCLQHLQFAVTIARLEGVPLADECYRTSLADTIDELASWLEREASIHHNQKSE
jgi:hypothetical protein